MNKQITIDKNMKIMFAIDLFVLVTLILFRYVYTSIGYYYRLINISLILNLLFLILCVINTFYSILGKKSKKYMIITIYILLAVYILFNTLGIILINKPIENKYKKISQGLISYCERYSCDTYETKYIKEKRKLIIQKTYFDYDNNENSMTFETIYDKDKIIKIIAYIDSKKDLYSEKIIKEQLDSYFELFNEQIDENYVLEAFENRFNGKIKHGKFIYQVKEEYNNGNLIKLKTIVTLNITN